MQCSEKKCLKGAEHDFEVKVFCLEHYKDAVSRMRKRLNDMADEYCEKRVDVVEKVIEILSDEKPRTKAESRFTKARLDDGRWVEYDTLTNWLTVWKEGDVGHILEGYEYY